MDKLQQITWFAGLFEGEGTFNIVRNLIPKAMSIQMTDLDVLLQVQEFFGGSVNACRKQKDHHKDIWKWTICGAPALELARQVHPYLLKRRQERCADFIELYENQFAASGARKQDIIDMKAKVVSMSATGMTHAEIAKSFGKDRTYITHIINRAKKQSITE